MLAGVEAAGGDGDAFKGDKDAVTAVTADCAEENSHEMGPVLDSVTQ